MVSKAAAVVSKAAAVVSCYNSNLQVAQAAKDREECKRRGANARRQERRKSIVHIL